MAPVTSDAQGGGCLSTLLPWWRKGSHEAAPIGDVAAWLLEALPPLQDASHRAGAAVGKPAAPHDSPYLDGIAAERSGGDARESPQVAFGHFITLMSEVD